MGEEELVFRCKFRMTGCNPGKTAYSVIEGEDERGIPKYKTEMRNSVMLQMSGVKDDIYGPATPHANLTMSIANTELANKLLAAFKEHYLDVEGFPEQVTGVLMEADFRVVGPAPIDTYP